MQRVQPLVVRLGKALACGLTSEKVPSLQPAKEAVLINQQKEDLLGGLSLLGMAETVWYLQDRDEE